MKSHGKPGIVREFYTVFVHVRESQAKQIIQSTYHSLEIFAWLFAVWLLLLTSVIVTVAYLNSASVYA